MVKMRDARVRVISAMRGGDGDEDDDGLAAFSEEIVDADTPVIIHFDLDRVSRIQGRYHEPGWLERESGSIEACAWVVHADEARIEHRSKTIPWAWRPEDDMEKVDDAQCRIVEGDDTWTIMMGVDEPLNHSHGKNYG